ncbi:DUF6998 domain-containing protein [Nocardioides stalactiti]|uniref:DUF6998 domain-containing protein n=1 Tax=Nocardioides stalactiti TaxID=2755356 RepID=UPI001C7EE969|nr:hypothetical protein [Nocardioides stalactiti]
MNDAFAERSEAVGADLRSRTARTAVLVEQLHAIVTELEAMHPGRKFPLDGHLVGSIGEAAAEAMFDLELVTASSTGHDAIARDGRRVEIKATYGTRGVAIRPTSHGAAAALIVLRLSRQPGVQHEVVYNGPLEIAFGAKGRVQSNGQAPMSLSRLRELNAGVAPEDRVPHRRE